MLRDLLCYAFGVSSLISSVSLVYSGFFVKVVFFILCCSVGGIIDLPFSCLHPPILLLNVIDFFVLLKCSCLITKASDLTLHTSTPPFTNLV